MQKELICYPVLLPQEKTKDYGPNFAQYVGKLFKNKDGVLNIPLDEEDVIKSAQHFGNFPQHLYLVSDKDITKVGEVFYLEGTYNHHDGKSYIGRAITPGFCSEPWEYSILFKRKVIASTDKTLGLPLISEKWISKVYVPAQGNIDKVKIEMTEYVSIENKHQFFGPKVTGLHWPDGEVIILPINYSRDEARKIAKEAYTKFAGLPSEFDEWFNQKY